MSKKIKIILIISLLLNILLIGFHIGIVAKKQWHSHYRKPLHMKFSNSLTYLPKVQQQQLAGKLHAFQQQDVNNRRKMKLLHRNIFNVLLAPVFDPDLYEEKNQQLEQLKQQESESLKNFIKNMALSLDQQQRKSFFGTLKKR